MPIQPGDLRIRALEPCDIPRVVDYWTGNSAEFWRMRGVDKAKLSSHDEFVSGYERMFREGGKVPGTAVILLRGEPVGLHTLTDIVEGESAVFHAHIWSEELRGLGLGVYSYLKAAEFFFTTLKLKKILFKTPNRNPLRGGNRFRISHPYCSASGVPL
jgi:RimJ/RimL family protein N-acetyltransferase